MALRDTWHRTLVYFGLAEEEDPRYETVRDPEPEIELEEWPGGRSRCVQLVLPHQVDLGDRRIAVTSPLGAALLGAREGEQIRVGYDGDRGHVYSVLSVRSRHRSATSDSGASGVGAGEGLLRPGLTVFGRDPY